jgi:methyl coenzyme M reductase beta subunit
VRLLLVLLLPLAACSTLDSVFLKEDGTETTVGEAIADEVEEYASPITSAIGSVVSTASSNPVLGGASAAGLLAAATVAVGALRKKKGTPPE